MGKICDVAHVIKVEIPDKLADFNADENEHRAKLSFVYVSTNNEKPVNGDMQALLSSLRSASPYSLIIDLSKFDFDGDDGQKCEELTRLFKGNDLLFTTFEFTISELTDGKHTAVHNDERTYTKLSNSYIGKNDADADVFQSIKDRLHKQIEDSVFEWGEFQAEENDNNRNRRH